ncbi:MAG: thioredoxin family protein [Nitrospinae bacterium]|nr:thioredoxin family protein [Nitrospinota bacterium]
MGRGSLRFFARAVPLMVALSISAGQTAGAAEIMPFDGKKFAEAQKSGVTIIVGAHADWCPTCKKQEPVIENLSKDGKFATAIVFKVNFDTDKEALKLLKISYQSTLIVFKGNKEAGRSVGETDPGKIRALFEKGI